MDNIPVIQVDIYRNRCTYIYIYTHLNLDDFTAVLLIVVGVSQASNTVMGLLLSL